MSKKVPCAPLAALIMASAALAVASPASASSHQTAKPTSLGGGGQNMHETQWPEWKVELVKKLHRIEKCYGIAPKGKNDCGTRTGKYKHGCAGKAKKDNSKHEWINVLEGNCKRLGGSTKSGGKK